MAPAIHILGRAITCALGDDLHQIGVKARNGCMPLLPLTLELTCGRVRRPFCAIGQRQPQWDAPSLMQLILSTAQRALADAALDRAQAERMTLLLGTGSLTIPEIESEAHRAQLTGERYCMRRPYACGLLAERLALDLNSRGPAMTFTTACTASATALIHGADLIASGQAEHVLVVGVEPFSRSVFLGFESLGLLSATACRPLDAQRDGIVLGEACSALVIGARPATRKNDWRILAGALGCDTTSVTSNGADGSRIASTIQEVLQRAELPASAISAIKIHGTGSGPNDESEVAGLRQVFGARMPAVTGLKPLLGHTLGACGTSEVTLLTAAADAGFIPPLAGFRQPDPQLGIAPLTQPLPWSGGVLLASFFGFGGSCTALLLSDR